MKIYFKFFLFICALNVRALTLGSNENLIEQKVAEVLVKQIFQEINLPLTVIPLPPARAKENDLSGKINGEIARIAPYGQDKPSLMRVEPSYYYLKSAAYCLKDSKIEINKKEDLSKLSVAGIRGVAHSDEALHGVKNVLFLKSSNQMFDFLERKRVEVVIDTQINGRQLLRNPKYQNSIKQCGVFNHFDLYIYLNINYKEYGIMLSDKILELKNSGKLELMIKEAEELVLKNEALSELSF